MKNSKPKMKVNVLGTEYKVYIVSQDEQPLLQKNDGFIIPEKKEIYLDENNSKVHQERVLSHELVHAYLYESGLDVESWGSNEEIVDWISIQLNKMFVTIKESTKRMKELNENGTTKRCDATNSPK